MLPPNKRWVPASFETVRPNMNRNSKFHELNGKKITMNYIYRFVIVLIAPFLLVPIAFADESGAYSMNNDWKSCSTSGIVDSKIFSNCTTYTELGKNFESCENPPKTIYFARHAEKRFRDIEGKNNAPMYILSRTGQRMAQHLSKVFESTPVKMIYTSEYTRTRQTACPLMSSKRVDRQIVCKLETKSDRFLQGALCKSHKNEVVVVIGHADTVDEMLINLKAIGPRDGFKVKLGELYKVTFRDGKAKLEQPPIRYWNCDASECHKKGALDVKLD